MSLILGIESSCDETAAALVTSDRRILAQAGRAGGGAPALWRRRARDRRARPCRDPARPDRAGARPRPSVDRARSTRSPRPPGPGLIGGVMVGLVTGKGLALAAGKPLIAVNHLEGHALSPLLADPDLDFPYLLLLVSGGHCQLLRCEGVGGYRRLATTIDDAAGEAFDKSREIARPRLSRRPGGRARGASGRSEGGAAAAAAGRLGRAAFLLRRPEERGAARARRGRLSAERTSPPRFQQAVVDCLVDRTAPRARRARRRDRAGRRRRRRGQPGDPRARWPSSPRRSGLPFVAPPLLAVHRQCGDDRLGGRRALRGRA